MCPIDDTSHVQIEKSVGEIDWQKYLKRSYTPSPVAWEDEVLYFLMLDRFSDGKEEGYGAADNPTPMFRFEFDAYTADRAAWQDKGNQWLGGTLKGLESKIGYLKGLGVTAIWISPVFKQTAFDPYSYHGYGIQNFLDVDPHFGSRQDLRDLVDAAHQNNIYVILDIIFNHSGDVFDYQPDRYQETNADGTLRLDPRWDGRPYPVAGFRNAFGEPNLPFGLIDQGTFPYIWPNDAVWPRDLQPAPTFTKKGHISSWDYDPEFYEGDFLSLKDIDHGCHARDASNQRLIDNFYVAPALNILCEVYKFWIAYADIDGYRIDTVKHMEPGATRYFGSVLHEFAQSVGKENFYLIGEITGGRQNAFHTMEITGLDAALGINDIPDKLEYLAKGYRNPAEYFDLFRNSMLVKQSSHVWFGKHVVTLFDDHDQVRKGGQKARFCGDHANNGYAHLPAVLGLNLCSMGIPCLYYGTEQGFDGFGDNDRFLRECMFGGPFGSLQSTNRHFFNDNHDIYRIIAEIAAVRKLYFALRRGRQYLRQISASGEEGSFGLPQMIGGQIRSVVPWSRIFNNQEMLLAINTDADIDREAWVTIDNDLHQANDKLTCVYSTDPTQKNTTVTVAEKNGKAVKINLPPGCFAIFA